MWSRRLSVMLDWTGDSRVGSNPGPDRDSARSSTLRYASRLRREVLYERRQVEVGKRGVTRWTSTGDD